MVQVRCENPTIICNPKLPELLYRYGVYYLGGNRKWFIHRKRHLVNFDWRPFNPKYNHVTIENINNYYVLDEKTGECFPVYYAVPCGKCDVCKDHKTMSFVHRCEMESQSYNVFPWFVTLTYAPSPFFDNKPHVRHVQLFLKRLRINLVRNGYKERIRYCCVSEYGKEKNRCHYHLIIWNLCPNIKQGIIKGYHDVYRVIRDSWKLGRTQCSLIRLDRSDDGTRGLKYVAKYIAKNEEVPKGFPPNIFLSSRRHGGIGAYFIDKHIREIRNTLNPNYNYVNKFNGKVNHFVFSRYVINRVFPPFCKLVPLELRKAVTRCVEILAIFRRYAQNKYYQYLSYTEGAIRFYRQYMFAPWDLPAPKFAQLTVADCNALDKEWRDTYSILYSGQSLDFADINRQVDNRNNFLAKLFENVEPFDIHQMANVIREKRAQMRERQSI